jgi:hypothetical protein
MVFTRACSVRVVASASAKGDVPRSSFETPCASQAVLCNFLCAIFVLFTVLSGKI